MTNKTNIKRLLDGCKKQDWAAQKELYLLFADDMMSIAIRYAKDLPSAKDLVQDTFLTFFNKIDMYDPSKGALGAWLRRVLINKYFAEYRKGQRLLYPEDAVLPDQETDLPSAIDTLEAEDILGLLKELPEGCRIIFNLKVVEGYNHNEIGDMLKITASASRSQLTRAKKLLRRMINERGLYSNEVNKQYRSKPM